MRSKLLLTISAFILFIIPDSNFGQAPDLGTASSFALFTSLGSFDNLGATSITGDIGSNSYALTGFPPGTVTGQIHSVPDGITSQAATDLGLAYGYLSTLGGVVLGASLGGQTITTGVYNTGAASSLNGNLTLDGQGDPDALFIIRIGGALSVSASSNVILINSASLCNVYWQIAGQFDLAANSVFRGTVIVDGAINLLAGSSLFGKGLSKGGSISSNSVTINNNLVVAAGIVTGPGSACQAETGVIYSVPAITNATAYIWALPSGATITAGDNTNSITVNYSAISTSGNVTVQGSNSCGTGTVSANYPVTVNPMPATTLIYHF
jgi:hypothetical protein